MKNKIIICSLLLASIMFLSVPAITLAAWWNPLSWFQPSTNNWWSSLMGIKPKNNAVDPVKTINALNSNFDNQTLPDANTGKNTGSQPVIKQTSPTAGTQKNKIQSTSPATTDIKDKVRYIVQIVCPVKNGTMSGTGTIIYGSSATDNKVLTNKHVLTGATGPCGVYQTLNYESQPTLYYKTSNTFIFSKNYDLAVITPDVSSLTPQSNTNIKFNAKEGLLNSNIYILGYPPSAGNNITLTKGIISGTENINGITMYKTDAKIDSGNSGGATFNDSGEFIGIPTLASQGNFSSYGYIVPVSVISTFLNTVETEGYAKQNWNDPGLTLYTVSPSNTVPDIPQNTQPSQPQQDDSQLKIEKCKSEYNSNKSIETADLDKQLSDTKASTEAMAEASYKECTDRGVSSMPTGTSPEAFNAYIALIKTSCQNSFAENQRKAAIMFDSLKSSEYAKLEQQLQQVYQSCLNK